MARLNVAAHKGAERRDRDARVKAAAAAGKPAKSAAKPIAAEDDDDDSSSTSDEDGSDEDEDADVSKKGLARLMQALGDDGLSELDKAHLGLVSGVEGSDEDEDDEDDDDDVELEEELIEDDEEDDEDEDEDEDNELFDIEAEEAEEEDIEEGEEDESDEAVMPAVVSNGAKAKDSLAASIARSGLVEDEDDEEDDDEDPEGVEAIALESLSEAALAALPESVRAARMYREKINNEDALRRVREEIALSGPSSSKGKGTALPWIETLVVPYDKSIQELVGAEAGAADDDLKRELEFYKQALHTATQGRVLAAQANLPFTRPPDYFAEMVKSDEHMERVRQRLLDERAGLKASDEARKQRELKKFGKKVQVEKQLERQRNKREFEDKVKGFKRKRQGPDGGDSDDGGDGDFDVRLESAFEADKRNGGSSRGARGGASGTRGRGGAGGKPRRDARDAKYGFGGKKRHSKENTRESTNDFGGASSSRGRGGRGGRGGSSRGGSARGGRGGMSSRGGAKRPGKARRASGRG